MEDLANLTRADINNGALIRMLAKAGIPDVQEYIKEFHHETEELIKEEFEQSKPNRLENDEQIVPPADIERWIASFRPNLDDTTQPPLAHQEEEKQPTPRDMQSWITGLRLHLDDPTQLPPPPAQKQPQHKGPTDLSSWLHQTTPTGLHSSTTATNPVVTTDETTLTRDDNNPAVTGNLSTWLTDWSKNLTEQPPPTSLDNWLQRLVPTNMHEPLNKGNTPKARLNNYLNAAQDVLSQHGYDVSTQVKPTANAPPKSGMFGNVKQMYFLVSAALPPPLSLLIARAVDRSGRCWTRTTTARSPSKMCRSCCKRWVWAF